MDNLPNHVSRAEHSSWKKWAEKHSSKPSPSKLATGLTESYWEQLPAPMDKSPYQSCSSCRRNRIR